MPRPRIIHFATIKNNKLVLNNPNHFNRSIQENFKEGEVVAIELSTPKKIRTLSQNNYLWLYYQIISDDTCDDVNSLHEYFKRTLLAPKFIKVLNKEIKIPGNTAELSKADFSEYINRIEELTKIPSPNTELYLYEN